MEKNQKIYISAKDSDYLHEIIRRKNWQALIELASTKNTQKDLLFHYFATDESKEVLEKMTEEQIFNLIDNSPQDFANLILQRMVSLCDSDKKYTNIALKLMRNVYGHGGLLKRSSIINCLPLNVIKVIIDSRIPYDEFHFGPNKQEFFSYILSVLSGNAKKTYDYKNLKESDVSKGFFTYILVERNSFPLERREVFKQVIQSFKECFAYIESNKSIDWKSVLIGSIINPLYDLILTGLRNDVWDYRNDKEIIDSLREVFEEFYYSKFFRSSAANPILNERGNSALLTNGNLLEEYKIIPKNYYYKVFSKAVQENKENFIDQITRVFFIRCPFLKYIRELDDGIYKTLFNATIDMSVRELIERKRSDNFAYCCRLLSQNRNISGSFVPRYEECLSFIKSVISKIFDKKKTLNVDVTSYPEICCYILNTLVDSDEVTPYRNTALDVAYLIDQVNQKVHVPLNFLDDEMRNKLVVGVIRHPVDDTKFSNIITSNNPTTLANYICYFKSVQDVKLILPKEKRNTVDKYGFRDSRSAYNPRETCKMNLVETFLHTLRFWENHDKSLFNDGYISYYHFVRKILMEAINTNDNELKKVAIGVYYRFSELVSLMKNAKYIDIRMRIASLTFLTPLAVIVGSELDASFVDKYIAKFIQPFNAHSYHTILSEIISRSHIDMNYEDDEDDETKSSVDPIFKKISIDTQYSIATKSLLALIKANPVKKFNIYYTQHINEDFFISKKRFINFIKNRFESQNQIIISLCNPLQIEYPLDLSFNSPTIEIVKLKHPEYKLSHFVFLELSRFVSDEYKNYSPKLFKTSLTKALISIQSFIQDLASAKFDTFQYTFTLDPPTVDTDDEEYQKQCQYNITVLYSRSFFDFLNEINKSQNSIYNDESYEVIKEAFIARFLNEEDFLKQQSQPPPKFNGFDISIKFDRHRNSDNILNIMKYKQKVENHKNSIYKAAYELNKGFQEFIDHFYNVTKMLGDQTIDDVFNPDFTVHQSRERSPTSYQARYRKNVHKCFTFLMDSLNKSKSDIFINELDSLERIFNFHCIKKCCSNCQNYSMLTKLFDLLINDFVSSKPNTTKMYKNRLANYDDIYKLMVKVSRIASPNIGHLDNIQKLTTVSEKVVSEKVSEKDPKLFKSIFKCGNIDQILTCMNSPLFLINAPDFYSYLVDNKGLIQSKEIVNKIIDEVLNKGRQILDDFHVSLASCSIHPLLVGYPAPKNSLEYLKKITNRNLSAKRAACANSVYYGIMNHTCNNEVPINDIMETIENAHKKSPDEIIAFFCLLIDEQSSLNKMNQMPALNDLANTNAIPKHFVINQGPVLTIPKEIGELYYSVIEKVILSGLKSKKSHIYELTVTVLNEINVGPEIHKIIAPFIVKGLKEIEPSDDNEAFLKYATSFTMKSPDFDECFQSYKDCLTKIKKHSFAILKANSHFNEDSPYPEPFKKLENSFSTIIEAIEKPFLEFKEENEMVAVSLFCRKLNPILVVSRPAIGRDIFLRLESYTKIFGDEMIEQMVKLYKKDKKEESLSKFIVIVTHHEELVINVPNSLNLIYSNLRSSFTVNHTIELSDNLADSALKLGVSMQRAYSLARLLAPDVLSHIPVVGQIDGQIKSEDEIVQILSNLGIFCKLDEPTQLLDGCIMKSDGVHVIEEPVEMPSNSINSIRILRRHNAKMAPKIESCVVECEDEQNLECEVEEVCDEGEHDFDDEKEYDYEDDEDNEIDGVAELGGGEGEGEAEASDENDLNEDQIKDAFDIFS